VLLAVFSSQERMTCAREQRLTSKLKGEGERLAFKLKKGEEIKQSFNLHVKTLLYS